MFVILFRALAKPGKRQELLDFLKKDCQFCEDHEKGTLRFDVLADPENENGVYVYEAYKDRPAFETHKENPLFQKWEPPDGSKGLKEKLVALYAELFTGEPLCLLRSLPSSGARDENPSG